MCVVAEGVCLLQLYIIFAFTFYSPRLTDENKLKDFTTKSYSANMLKRSQTLNKYFQGFCLHLRVKYADISKNTVPLTALLFILSVEKD